MWGRSDASIEAAEYRARAGALTLSYLTSGPTRDTLRAVLAQAATGIYLVDAREFPMPDRAERVNEVFADRYLLEPADPGDDPDDPETMMQPTPAGREVPLVGATLKSWLGRCPAGPIELGQGSGEEDTAPIAAADVEAALRLTLPLLRMKSSLSGSCSLEVELDEGVLGGPVGMTARIEEGRVVACEPGIDPEADAWVAGSTAGWLDAVIERNQRGLRSGGDWRLPRDLFGGLHKVLFGR